MNPRRSKHGPFKAKTGPDPKPLPKPPPTAEQSPESMPALVPTVPVELAKDLQSRTGNPVDGILQVPKSGELSEPLDPVDPTDQEKHNWTSIHGLLLDALDKYLRQYKRFPSYEALARITGINPATVKSHFDSYDWTRVRKKAQFLTEKLVYEMYEQIRSGKVKKSVLNLYFKIINQWRDGIDINIHGQYDFRFLGDRVKTASDPGDRTRNLVTFLSAINGRMGESSLRSN
jgi:hypothetical protein